jgi:hypothetical protein
MALYALVELAVDFTDRSARDRHPMASPGLQALLAPEIKTW